MIFLQSMVVALTEYQETPITTVKSAHAVWYYHVTWNDTSGPSRYFGEKEVNAKVNRRKTGWQMQKSKLFTPCRICLPLLETVLNSRPCQLLHLSSCFP